MDSWKSRLCLYAILIGCFTGGLRPLDVIYPLTIIPDTLTLGGDVTTRDNCVNATVCDWAASSPTGAILLGVAPDSPDPAAWEGGTATLLMELPDVYAPSRLVIEVNMPEGYGKGLHSPRNDRYGQILFDGEVVWDQRMTQPGAYGDYYATDQTSILTTVVLNSSGMHNLSFSVQPNTAWDIQSISIRAFPMPEPYLGIGYSPYRDCQTPGAAPGPAAADVRNDLARLAHTTNVIRTYSSTGINALVPGLARERNLTVFPGAWLDYPKTSLSADDAEIQGLIQLACDYNPPGVIVGNEYYLRHRTTDGITYLVNRIQEVRAGILSTCGKDIPITTAEVDGLIFQYAGQGPETVTGIQSDYLPVIAQVDFVMEHIYPFWNGMAVDGAAEFSIGRYVAARNYLETAYSGQNKWLIIGETGWPSGGEANGAAVPTHQNQQRYLLELLPLAEQHEVHLMVFDAFDELWKVEEAGGVGQRWGYAYTDRSAKYSFYGVLIPAAELPVITSPSRRQVFLPSVLLGNAQKNQAVYRDWPEPVGSFVPSGWMGDIEQITAYECDRGDPYEGEMAARYEFSAGGEKGWAGVVWQYPENNWGDQPEALNLSWANQLSFWAKGKTGEEKVRFFVGGIGTSADPYPDSLRPEATTGFIQLSQGWKRYTINLAGKDLSHLIGGFGWVTDRCANPDGAVFWVDWVRFEYEPGLQPAALHGDVFDVYTDAGGDNHFTPSGWMGDAVTPGNMTLNECSTASPRRGTTAIQAAHTGGAWGGASWLYPAENWGGQPGGYDLRGAKEVTFWAKSDTPNLAVKFFVGGAGYAVDGAGNALCAHPNQPYPDSVCPKITVSVVLSTQWTLYRIPLAGANLQRTVSGFGFTLIGPGVFYLDDIQYQFNSS